MLIHYEFSVFFGIIKILFIEFIALTTIHTFSSDSYSYFQGLYIMY